MNDIQIKQETKTLYFSAISLKNTGFFHTAACIPLNTLQ